MAWQLRDVAEFFTTVSRVMPDEFEVNDSESLADFVGYYTGFLDNEKVFACLFDAAQNAGPCFPQSALTRGACVRDVQWQVMAGHSLRLANALDAMDLSAVWRKFDVEEYEEGGAHSALLALSLSCSETQAC
jgi:hypothetical protein